MADRDIFLKITEDVAQVNVKGQGEECTYRGTSKLEVTMSEEYDGATFMCSILEAPTESTGSPANSDQVHLMLKSKFGKFYYFSFSIFLC